MTKHSLSENINSSGNRGISPVSRQRFGEFDVYIKGDGQDYLQLFRSYLDGTLPTREFTSLNPRNRASLVEFNGKKYVIKKDGMPTTGVERKLWRILFGPFYSTLMPKIHTAIQNGCQVVVDIFLVAEKMRGHFAEESYIIMEYAEGTGLSSVKDFEPYRQRIRDAFIELHRHGLSLGDPNPGNLVLTKSDTIKMFDFSVRGTQFTGKAKDRIKCRKDYGIDIPVQGFWDALANKLVLLQLRKTAFFRKMRGKPYIEY